MAKKLAYSCRVLIIIIVCFFSLAKPGYAAGCMPQPPLVGCIVPTYNITCPITSGKPSTLCCTSNADCTTAQKSAQVVAILSGPCLGVDPKFQAACVSCATNNQTYTALGCVDNNPSGFVQWILKNIIGLAGGIAFLLILYGGFQVLTSGGNPEKLNEGKDIIIAAMTGILLIVFSVVLLKIIGLDILQIPGFGT